MRDEVKEYVAQMKNREAAGAEEIVNKSQKNGGRE